MLGVTEEEIRYFKQLDERQQRLYLGLKAKLLGVDGVKIISEAYGVDKRTVSRGQLELLDLPETLEKRIRKKGGGAKKN